MPNEPTTDADRRQAAAAYAKRQAGGTLTKLELAAIKRVEKEKEERDRWRYYESISQKHWKQMSGRQAKTIIEQAARYGIPFSGAQVSLPRVVKALHDFLADNYHRLNQDDDEILNGADSPALERCREAKHKLLEIDLAERRGKLVDRDAWWEHLNRLAGMLRQFGETLQRDYGEDARRLFDEMFEEWERGASGAFAEPELTIANNGSVDADGGGSAS